ncbi:hypothetical protein FGO68_gene7671 [Halteria grandinella]|uniref:Uncharacterized protein n=1 Tax=Halteria grandinella TaxID=5974 RepID=A0A8J8NXZ2_HALGN|nr:hypothetical protein FGO68_gene7671 [Halteria grandinella]
MKKKNAKEKEDDVIGDENQEDEGDHEQHNQHDGGFGEDDNEGINNKDKKKPIQQKFIQVQQCSKVQY